jgi:hypothetical protein
MSTDTQSIDISNQDPIKMTYTNSLYAKTSAKVNPSLVGNIICSQDIQRSSSNSSSSSSINSFSGNVSNVNRNKDNTNTNDLTSPSYVTTHNHHSNSDNTSTMNGNNNSIKDIKRKKSFRLAGVKIPTEMMNNIMTNEHTTKPYNTQHQTIHQGN